MSNTSSANSNGNFAIYMMSVIALLFAYIVTKDVSLPGPVLYGLFGLAAVVVFLQGFNRPEIVTYFLVVYMPFSRILVGDFGGLATALNLTNIIIIFMLVVWFNGRYAEGESLWLKTNLNIPISLFIFAGFISLAKTYGGQGGFGYILIEFKRWITPIFLYFLVLNTIKQRWMIRDVVYIIMIVTTIVGLMAIYDYINVGASTSLEKSRIGGICEQPNQLAAFFCYYMFLLFGFFLCHAKNSKAWLLLIPFLICFRGIMVTFSRGGYLAFAAGLMAIIWFRNKFLFIVLLLVSILVYFNPTLLPGGIRYRMGQTIEHNNAYSDTEFSEADLEASSQTRVEVWKGAIEMIKENPIFGVGYGMFYFTIKYYWSGAKEIDAHNTYLIIAAEMGIPTLIVFLWIIFQTVLNNLYLYRLSQNTFSKSFSLGVLGGLFALLVSNMFGSRLNSQEVSSYLWILMALIQRLIIIEENEQGIQRGPQKLDSGYSEETNYAE